MARPIFRRNSRLAKELDDSGVRLVSHIASAIQRILPHVEVDSWVEGPYTRPGVHYTSSARDEIRFVVSFHLPDAKGVYHAQEGRSLSATIRRRQSAEAAKRTLDAREYDICCEIFERADELAADVRAPFKHLSRETVEALVNSFDETVIAAHLQRHFNLELTIGPVFAALRRLSEQTYENKALVFGCIISTKALVKEGVAQFPDPFLDSKKYKALSDGFRTAYEISSNGYVAGFVELDGLQDDELTEKHYFPDWAEALARASLSGRCAIALTRQGDILVFDKGTLRFTYRFGRWQYWNHANVIGLLRDLVRVQHVPKKSLGRVVGAIYRAALDISFRRSGALFVVLRRKGDVHEIVREGDAIGDADRSEIDKEFDAVIGVHKMQSLPRAVAVDISSLDGAVVLANSGQILGYGAVLQPRKTGRTTGAEGSRTKAAIGASNYGAAIKISSDGDISIYHKGRKFIAV